MGSKSAPNAPLQAQMGTRARPACRPAYRGARPNQPGFTPVGEWPSCRARTARRAGDRLTRRAADSRLAGGAGRAALRLSPGQGLAVLRETLDHEPKL